MGLFEPQIQRGYSVVSASITYSLMGQVPEANFSFFFCGVVLLLYDVTSS